MHKLKIELELRWKPGLAGEDTVDPVLFELLRGIRDAGFGIAAAAESHENGAGAVAVTANAQPPRLSTGSMAMIPMPRVISWISIPCWLPASQFAGCPPQH